MRPETLALIRTSRTAQAGIAAAVLLALVSTAKLVDLHSSKPVVTLREKGTAMPAVKATPALAIDGPLMPHYTPPQPPPAGPTVPDQPQAPAAVIAETRAAVQESATPATMPQPLPPPPAPRFGPIPPTAPIAAERVVAAAPVAPAPAPAPASTAAYCPRCGEVVGLTVWPDMTEVHVRFEDGSTHAMRTGVPSRWRIGDRVRAEGGRLVAD